MIYAILLTFAASTALATTQIPDKIYFEGDSYNLSNQSPIRFFFRDHPEKKPKEGLWSTNLYRGYVATYEIRNNSLYLKDLRVQLLEDPSEIVWKSVKDKVVPSAEELLLDSFTGILELSYSNNRTFILLEVKQGKITGKRSFTNQQFEAYKDKLFQLFKQTDAYNQKLDQFKKYNSLNQTEIDYFIRQEVFSETKVLVNTHVESCGEKQTETIGQ